MKIISQTSNEIKIGKIPSKGSFKNNLYFFLFVSFIFPVFPLGILIGAMFPIISQIGVTRVICDRVEPQQVDCQVSQSKFFDLVRAEPVSMKFVRSAKYNVIETVNTEKANTYKYNFQLTNKFGGVKTFDSDQDTANKTVQSLNSFLASQQTSLKYIADDRLNPNLIIALVFNISLCLFWLFIFFHIWRIILWLSSYREIVLNKSERSFSCIETTFILGKKIDNYKLTDVAKVDVLYYDIPRITMTSGMKYDLDAIGDRQAAIKVANDLNRFIGLPEEEDPVVKE